MTRPRRKATAMEGFDWKRLRNIDARMIHAEPLGLSVSASQHAACSGLSACSKDKRADMLTSDSRRLERAEMLMAPRPASAGLGDRDGDVVAGVGGVRGELGVQDFGRVGHGAQFGRTCRYGV